MEVTQKPFCRECGDYVETYTDEDNESVETHCLECGTLLDVLEKTE